MDLQACTHSHFIAAIQGGQVIKIPTTPQTNTNKPPKFRSIQDIYFSHPHHALTNATLNRSLAVAMPSAEVKTEYIQQDNELDFGGLTLRQLKDIYKSHKRKPSTYVHSKSIKLEDTHLPSQVDEDELDLKETLGSWKHKLLKKTIPEIKGISKSSITSNLYGGFYNKSANLPLLDITSEIYMPLQIKVEDEEYASSQPQPQILTTESGNAFQHSCRDQDLYLEQPVSITNSICCLNQVSYGHLDKVGPQNPVISQHLANEESVLKENSAILSENSLIFSDSDVKREADTSQLMTCDEPLAALLEADCSSFQIDHSQYRCPIQPFSNENASSNVDVSCTTLYNDCQDVELTNSSQVSMDDNRNIEDIGSSKATNFNSFVKLDNNIHLVDAVPSLVKPTFVVEDKQLLVSDISTEGVSESPVGPKRKLQDIKCFEICNDSTSTVAIGREAKNYNVAVQDENSLPLVKNAESLHNVTSAIESKQSLVIDTSFATLTRSPDIQTCIDVAQPIGLAASERIYENKLEQQPPERLFSARKTISPNSKEKLNRAMISAEIQDDTHILFSGGLKAGDCREKLFIEQNAVDTSLSRSTVKKARIILTSKRLQALRTTQTGPNSRKSLKKGKIEKNLSDIQGTINDSRVSSSSVQAARTCSTSASCYQNAIAFSQQQMVDIERLATKLLNEMQMMKDMVVDTLHPESRTYSTSRSNTDKARVAVENVKKVEDATKRMLSMMTRDCNRFCKIMEISERTHAPPQKSNEEYIPESELCQNNLMAETKLDEEQVSPPKTNVHKERKIVFADEAGETLCHVKVL